MKQHRTPLVIFVAVSLCWTAFVHHLYRMALDDDEESAQAQALQEGRIAFEKDRAYRRWSARIGGVYAEISEYVPPNPYLEVPNRDVVTGAGQHLTLVNPAYMTRMVHDLMNEEAGLKGHITSMDPLRPENTPAEWEVRALRDFREGAEEVHELAVEDGKRVLRYMRPLVAEKPCLKCHAKQGYREGDVRGGISVTVPMAPYEQAQAASAEHTRSRYIIIFLTGLALIAGTLLAALRHERQRGRAERELRDYGERLKASEERFRALIEGAGDAIYIADTKGRFQMVNQEAARQSGYTREELLTMGVSGLDAFHNTPAIFAEFSRKLALEGKAAFETRHRGKSGREYPVEIHVVRVEVGSEGMLLGIARDISERKEAEAALERERSFSNALLDSLPAIFYLYTYPDLRLARWNRNHETLFGYSSGEMQGRSLLDWHPPEQREMARRAVDLVMEQGSHVVEVQLLTRDGQAIPFLVTGTRFEDSGQTFLMGVGVEITSLKRAEMQLVELKDRAEAANRAKSEFLATMSHEIRTPLNGVLGMLQLILRAPLDAETREYADTGIVAARGLLSILNDILDLSRIESGRLELRSECFSLPGLSQECFGFLRAQLKAKGLEARWRMAPELPEAVRGDQGRLRQVLFNLLGNAIKFTESGSVTLAVDFVPQPGPGRVAVLFTVSDTGIGIPEDKLDSVFEPFSQADASATRRFGGTGLGLTIVRRLVSMMDGHILMESRPGQGTEVTVAVPLEVVPGGGPGLDGPACPEPSPAPDLGKLTLLVVEDDRINQMAIRSLLEREGYAARVAGNGQEALALLPGASFDLVLMDIQMPVMDGMATTRAIRESEAARGAPRIPIIAMTAFAMAGDRETFLGAGMDGYIAKPLEMAEFEKVIGQVLAKRADER